MGCNAHIDYCYILGKRRRGSGEVFEGIGVLKGGFMNTSKVYQDSEGNDCTIWRMIEREPHWAANRVQEGEKAITTVNKLKQVLKNLVEVCPTSLGCDDFHHPLKDQHGAEEDCPPCCRYYKALLEASELINA